MGGNQAVLCFALVLYSSTAKSIPPEDLRFLGGPRRRGDAGGAPTREFGSTLPSDEADMCRFAGSKEVLRQKTYKQNPGGSRREIAKTKNKLWLRVAQLEPQPQISDHQKR